MQNLSVFSIRQYTKNAHNIFIVFCYQVKTVPHVVIPPFFIRLFIKNLIPYNENAVFNVHIMITNNTVILCMQQYFPTSTEDVLSLIFSILSYILYLTCNFPEFPFYPLPNHLSFNPLSPQFTPFKSFWSTFLYSSLTIHYFYFFNL